MKNNPFRETVSFYKTHLLGDIFVIVLSLIGGLIATYFDILSLKLKLDIAIVFIIYTLLCILISFPIILIINILSRWLKTHIKISKSKFDISKLRLAEEMVLDGTWTDYKEHSLTLINETGHDLMMCYVMLDEVAWWNFDDVWEVIAGDGYDRPFKWNRPQAVEGKIDIDNGERASFAVISHNEYPIYNVSEKRNDVKTDFYFLFWGEELSKIGYGSKIRLRISIRGKDQSGNSINPVIYLLFIQLKQQHGIPKVNIYKFQRIK